MSAWALEADVLGTTSVHSPPRPSDTVSFDAALSPVVHQRLTDMADFVAATDRWYTDMLTIPHGTLKTLMALGSRITGMIKRKGDGT